MAPHRWFRACWTLLLGVAAAASTSAQAPYTPRTNGKAERLIQTLLREWAYVRPHPSSYQRAQWLDRYLDHCNHARAHSSLTYLPPHAASRCAPMNNVSVIQR